MKKIKLLGEEVNISFNMAVEIAYEDIVDAAFSVESLQRQKNMLVLGMAAIAVNNPETTITLERLMTEASSKDVSTLLTAVTDEMLAWLKVPKVVEKKKEGRKKNS